MNDEAISQISSTKIPDGNTNDRAKTSIANLRRELGGRLLSHMRILSCFRSSSAGREGEIGHVQRSVIHRIVAGENSSCFISDLLSPSTSALGLIVEEHKDRHGPSLDDALDDNDQAEQQTRRDDNAAESIKGLEKLQLFTVASCYEQQPSTSFAADQEAASTSLSQPPLILHGEPLIGAASESNVERAVKQEAHVLSRIAELRRRGMWSMSRLPMIEMPPRNKTHWDYVLEELRWMAVDFKQERTFKRMAAKKFATQLTRVVRDKELKEERIKQQAVKDAKRVCAFIARMIRDFWQNVEKVVAYRAQEVLDSLKRKALDQQLELMVGHVDKLSEMVQEGLSTEKAVGNTVEDDGDNYGSERPDSDTEADEYDNDGEEEENVESDEIDESASDYNDDRAMTKESNMELDELLSSLPSEYLTSIGVSSTDLALDEGHRTHAHPVDVSARKRTYQEIMGADQELSDELLPQKHGRKKMRLDDDGADTKDSSMSVLASSVAQVTADAKIEATGDLRTSGNGIMKINYDRLTSNNSEERRKELVNIAEEALKLQPKGFTLETTQVRTEVPFLLRGVMREYQMVGLDWLVTLYERGLNGILADEMGLGKTIQTIALLAHLACKDNNWGPHLIVVPTSVILNWEMELKKWCPAFKILTYFGSQKERAEKRRGWSKPNAFHICITSYKIVSQDIRSFKHKTWQYFILDEAQNIKNFKSQRWQTLMNIRARRRLLLTGTPLQNSLMELWSLLHFLMPAIFSSHNDFKDWFCTPLNDMMEGNSEWNSSLVQRLHKVLRPFILRRLKSDVEKQLPEKSELVILCKLSKRQRYLYDDFMSQRSTRDHLKSGNVMSVLNIVMQLRKCCNHPNLFEPRPIVSPFVMQPLVLPIPAMALDICISDPGYKTPSIPECLKLNRYFFKSHFVCDEGYRLADNKFSAECSQVSEAVGTLPIRTGFRFCSQLPLKPRFQKSVLPSESTDIRDSAFYVSVENGTARVYQVGINSSGQRIIEECDPGVVTGNVPMNQRVLSGLVKGNAKLYPSHADTRRTDPDLKHENAISARESCGCSSVDALNKRLVPNSVLRARTVLNRGNMESRYYASKRRDIVVSSSIADSTVRNELPTSANINDNAAVNHDISPHPHIATTHNWCNPQLLSEDVVHQQIPAKRMKLAESQTTAYLPRELILPTVEIVEASRLEAEKRLLDINISRLRAPSVRKCHFISIELLSLLLRELNKRRSESDKAMHMFSSYLCNDDELTCLARKLNDWLDDAMLMFTIYVDGALADAPTICSAFKGRPAYIHELMSRRTSSCREIFMKRDHRYAFSSAMHKLQFPELRLIAYDCGKLQVLNVLLHELYLYKHRCLIFTQMARMLDVLQAFLSFHGYQYFRLDGTTGIEQRQALMERFNADPKIFCFILSTRAGGIGVNLTGADTVIFYDSDWNPTMDAQAQDRCHRIGQTRNVTIYRLISEYTIEENILRKAVQKRRLGELAIDEAGFTPEYFKKDNIRELFDGCKLDEDIVPVDISDNAELETAMAKIEDAPDVYAAKRANAEAKAEQAEFDECCANLPENNEKLDSKSDEFINQLKPVEQYAIGLLETLYKPDFEEELKEAEAAIASKKIHFLNCIEEQIRDENDDIELTYPTVTGGLSDEMVCVEFPEETMPIWMPLSPPVSENEFFNDLFDDLTGEYWYDRYIMSESELPSTVHELHRSRHHVDPITVGGLLPDVSNSGISCLVQNDMKVVEGSGATSESDRYKLVPTNTPSNMLQLMTGMCRSTAVKQEEHARYGMIQPASISYSNTYERSDTIGPASAPHIRNSVDDAIDSVTKMGHKSSSHSGHNWTSIAASSQSSSLDFRCINTEMRKPLSPPLREREAADFESIDWTICDDYFLLQSVTKEQQMPHHLHSSKSGNVVNWYFCSDYLYDRSGVYRSARQCSIHYQMIVLPREDGRMVAIDPVSKKSCKVPVSHSELNHIKRGRCSNEQQFLADKDRVTQMRTTHMFAPMKKYSERRTTARKSTRYKELKDALAIVISPSLASRMERRSVSDVLDSIFEKREQEQCAVLQAKEKRKASMKEENSFGDKVLPYRELSVPALPGIVNVRVSSTVEDAVQSPGAVSCVTSVSSMRSLSGVQCGTVSSNSSHVNLETGKVGSSNDQSLVNIGQRVSADSQATISAANHGNIRRISLPTSTNVSCQQHQVVTSMSNQMGPGQQPNTAIIPSQENVLAGGGHQQNTRMQFRQESAYDRQPLYRAISPRVKSNTSASLQRVPPGYSLNSQQSQVYSSAGHSGRTMIVAQGSDALSLNDSTHIQMIRPITTAVGYRHEGRKVTQRHNRMYVGSSERGLTTQQAPLRMVSSGQRVTQKRSTFQSRSYSGQQQVMGISSRAVGMHQIRAITRCGSNYQAPRMSTAGVRMSGSSGPRNVGHSVCGLGNSQQDQEISASPTSEFTQGQALPSISLSSHQQPKMIIPAFTTYTTSSVETTLSYAPPTQSSSAGNRSNVEGA